MAVYRSYFDQVRAANPHPSVHPYFERIIKPLITRDALETDDAADIMIDEEIQEIQEERAEEAKGDGADGEDVEAEAAEEQEEETKGTAEWEKQR